MPGSKVDARHCRYSESPNTVSPVPTLAPRGLVDLTFQWHLWLTRWGTSSNNPLLQWNHFWDRSNKVNHSHLNMSLFVLHSLLNRVFNQTQEFNSNIKFAIGYHSRRENKILLIIHTHIYYCDEYLGILNLNIDFCITTYNHSVWKY